MPVTIDITQVPQDKMGHPDFIQLRAEIENALSSPLWVNAFCIHEAGHLIYLSRAGVSEFAFNPPRIAYDPQQGTFNGYPAGVQAKSWDDNLRDRNWFFLLAQAYAAAGVFSRTLTNAPDSGDEEDWQNFRVFCDSVRQANPTLSIDEDDLWKKAKETVAKELRSPAFRRKAWEVANEIKPKLFDVH